MQEPIDIASGGPKAPCRDCSKRTSECHCHCEGYLAYEKERDAFRKQRYVEGLGRVFSKSRAIYMAKKAKDLL